MRPPTDSELDQAGQHVAARLDEMLLRLAEADHADGWYATGSDLTIARRRISEALADGETR